LPSASTWPSFAEEEMDLINNNY
jgi:hypothetical protein